MLKVIILYILNSLTSVSLSITCLSYLNIFNLLNAIFINTTNIIGPTVNASESVHALFYCLSFHHYKQSGLQESLHFSW